MPPLADAGVASSLSHVQAGSSPSSWGLSPAAGIPPAGQDSRAVPAQHQPPGQHQAPHQLGAPQLQVVQCRPSLAGTSKSREAGASLAAYVQMFACPYVQMLICVHNSMGMDRHRNIDACRPASQRIHM